MADAIGLPVGSAARFQEGAGVWVKVAIASFGRIPVMRFQLGVIARGKLLPALLARFVAECLQQASKHFGAAGKSRGQLGRAVLAQDGAAAGAIGVEARIVVLARLPGAGVGREAVDDA